jgi:hypothetical protein
MRLAMGCGAMGPAAKDVTKGTIRGAYEELDGIDDALRERVIHKLVDSPALRAAAHDLVASVVAGSVDGFAEAERDWKIESPARSWAHRRVVSERVAHDAIIGIREGIHENLNMNDPQVRDGMREIGIGLAQGVAQGTPTSPFTTTFAIATFVLGALLLISLGAILSPWSRARMSAELISRLAQPAERPERPPISGGRVAAHRNMEPARER